MIVSFMSPLTGVCRMISFNLNLQVENTVRPRDTRPQDARTLTMHVFEKGPKTFEMHVFARFSTFFGK